jgi:hypothetical protein
MQMAEKQHAQVINKKDARPAHDMSACKAGCARHAAGSALPVGELLQALVCVQQQADLPALLCASIPALLVE